MAELFSRTAVNFGGAFTAQNGLIVPNNGLTGVLMQNLQIQYAQMVNRLYELGQQGQKTNVYYVSGRSSGNLSAAHVIGPNVGMLTFYRNFSDVCQAQGNSLQIILEPNTCAFNGSSTLSTTASGTAVAAAAGAADTVKQYTAKFCVLQSIGLGVAAQDFIINSQAQLMFSGLDVT